MVVVTVGSVPGLCHEDVAQINHGRDGGCCECRFAWKLYVRHYPLHCPTLLFTILSNRSETDEDYEISHSIIGKHHSYFKII